MTFATQVVLDSNIVGVLVGIMGAGGLAIGGGLFRLGTKLSQQEQALNDLAVRKDEVHQQLAEQIERISRILDQIAPPTVRVIVKADDVAPPGPPG